MCVHAIAQLFVTLGDRLPTFTFSAEAPIKPVRPLTNLRFARQLTN